MNCTVIQRRLLSVEQPEKTPDDIKGHLVQCPACRAWQRRLVQMERLVPQLPVPSSTAKEQFLQRFLGPRQASGEPAALAAGCSERYSQQLILHPTAYAAGSPLGQKERGLRKLSVAFTLAASVLVFALAWWAWPQSPLRQEQAKLEQRLNASLSAGTPKERVLRLAQLAEQVHGEARTLAGQSERLEQRARFYSRIIGEHLIEQARQLPPEDRLAVLGEIAERLTRMESDASRSATQCKAAAPRSAAAFSQIARASQQGERDLRALMKG